MLNKIFSLEPESKSEIEAILSSTLELKQKLKDRGWSSLAFDKPYLVYQIFFEASTRTRVSFETACHRLGVQHSFFPMDAFTSLSKGESLADSLSVFEQNHPDLMIIRSPESSDVANFFTNSTVPVICAGYGNLHHPTQALLDLVTILEQSKKPLSGMNLLFVGDIKNSRVAHSHSILGPKLSYNLAQCSDPDHWAEEPIWKKFNHLDQAMDWADVVIRLRTQKERGSLEVSHDFMITKDLLEKHQNWLMHPGPFLRNEDFDYSLPEHKNSLIYKQKENGLYLRANLIKQILGKGESA